jgi:FeS assembly SUF system protein
MKPLPVIQPVPPPAAGAGNDADARKTADIVPDTERTAAVKPKVVAALSKVFDPEIPVNIYELGLVYDILVDRENRVGIRMTLTAPACPAAQSLPAEVRRQVAQIPGVSDVAVDIVWDPPWDRDRISDAAKLQLGLL